MSQPKNFDGFITPDGELVSIKEVDRIISILSKRTEDRDEIVQMLWALAEQCSEGGYLHATIGYYEKVLLLADNPAEKAEVLLAMGQAYERSRDFKAALEVYSRAFEFPEEPSPIYYYIRNNLAYCLNLQGRYEEAEAHCRAAIKIYSSLHNAHKNLGVSLRGLGRCSEAAKSFMTAIAACPEDGRALQLLENLIADNKEVLEQESGFTEQLQKCYEAVGASGEKLRIQ